MHISLSITLLYDNNWAKFYSCYDHALNSVKQTQYVKPSRHILGASYTRSNEFEKIGFQRLIMLQYTGYVCTLYLPPKINTTQGVVVI